MKYRLFTMIFVLCFLLAMSACNASEAARTLDNAEDRVEEKLDRVEDSVERAVRKAVTPAPGATPTLPAPLPSETAADSTITREQAENIALTYAGFTADQVTRLRTEFEWDDGVPQYDVQFYEGDWEYEFEIHGQTGKILSFDKDHKYD